MLLTDGRYNVTTPHELVDELGKKGVTVILVGIGLPDPVQLWKISNDPNSVLNMMDPKMVDSTAKEVKKVACSTPAPEVKITSKH